MARYHLSLGQGPRMYSRKESSNSARSASRQRFYPHQRRRFVHIEPQMLRRVQDQRRIKNRKSRSSKNLNTARWEAAGVDLSRNGE